MPKVQDKIEELRDEIKKVKEVVGSNSAKTFTLSVDTYANSTTGGYVGQGFDNLVNFLISSFLHRGQTNSIYGTKGDVLPVDNLRVQK